MKIGVIGLGVMGQRMLERLDAHARLKASAVFDADAAALQRTLAARPQLRAADSAAALIASPAWTACTSPRRRPRTWTSAMPPSTPAWPCCARSR